uniref:Pre-PUA domain-containing protein n=1 Tax=Panagrellus redivivus TaxID=6233 RepID=A0A7E4V0C6_PANRE
MFNERFKIISRRFVEDDERPSILTRVAHFNIKNVNSTSLEVVIIQKCSGELITLYLFGGQPLFFEPHTTQILHPTLYFSWNQPRCRQTVYLSDESLTFIRNGSDVMLDAILTSSPFLLPNLEKDEIVLICIRDKVNKTVIGPYAVGKAVMSTSRMTRSGMKGLGIVVLHRFRDYLWELGTRDSVPTKTAIDFVEIDNDAEEMSYLLARIAYDTHEVDEVTEEQDEDEETEDELLRRVFLYTVNTNIPADLRLPLDAGQFYSKYVLKSLPRNKRLEIKKTTWRKVTVFLNDLNNTAGNENWLIRMERIQNIDMIVEFNLTHPNVTTFTTLNPKIKVTECYSVTGDSAIHLSSMDIQKRVYDVGTLLSPVYISRILLGYVMKQNIAVEGESKYMCRVDHLLSAITGNPEDTVVKLHDVVCKLQQKMEKIFTIVHPDGHTHIQDDKIIHVIILVKYCTGGTNHIMTQVFNLHRFGIDAKLVAANLNGKGEPRVASGTGQELILKGIHAETITRLLKKFYGLDKKYIQKEDKTSNQGEKNTEDTPPT